MKDVLNTIGVMDITVLEMLHESNFIGASSPLPDNVGIMTLLFLDFLTQTCSDFDLEWCHEVVRDADKYRVVIIFPKQIPHRLDQDGLDGLREECEATKVMKGLAWKTEVSLSFVCGPDIDHGPVVQ